MSYTAGKETFRVRRAGLHAQTHGLSLPRDAMTDMGVGWGNSGDDARESGLRGGGEVC